ncbi:accessory gland-specific peptide 26Ab-like [Drosophila elegans]|uniref:accessory gland-specific peptide 26Ab-like n=1 Tax=Drosophila elegans TaxID=30023 RepID=UPI0007E5D1FD|nr:accessory gland-specific peptide 26Ab-like [Drosophila elegans]
MNYIVLICIFTYICVWRFAEAAPFISIQSSSRTRSQKIMNGLLRTLYDYNIRDNVDDANGQLVHSRMADFKSDIMSPEEQQKIRDQMVIL